jgi:hypothetical protein
MPYPFDPDQQIAINNLLADLKDFIGGYHDGDRGNAATFNQKLNRIEGVLAYLKANGGASGSLSKLSDVLISAPSKDQVLTYNGTEWVNTAIPQPPGVTFTAYQMDLTTTAVRIDDVNNLQDRIYNVQNIGQYNIYVGGSNTVGPTVGFKLFPEDSFQITLSATTSLWGVSDFGNVRISVARGH